jgi:hypothetical protein
MDIECGNIEENELQIKEPKLDKRKDEEWNLRTIVPAVFYRKLCL